MLDWLFTQTPLVYLTQSLWRDEAFSVLVAEYSFIDIIKITANDYTPPLYYFLLKIWMMVFGRSEEAIRMLSFMFYLCTVWVGYKFAKEVILIKNKWFAPVAIAMLALNPMLLYYAFEARTYSLVALLVVSSLYFLLKHNWKWYVVVATLAIYAHPYSLLALVAQGIYVIFWERPLLKVFLKKAGIVGLLYLPWFAVIVSQITRSTEMWYYPVTKELVRAILGSMFLGYEGTPDILWEWCAKLSVLILGIIAISFFNESAKKVQRLLLLSLFFPLIVVLGISFITPIFTQRYLIYITVFEIFLITLGIFSISNKWLKSILVVSVVSFLLFFNTWYPPQNTKQDFQTPFMEINKMMNKEDIILNDSALTFFNAEYYATYPKQVYLLREDDSPLPSYIGAILIPKEKWLKDIPRDKRVFMLREDGNYEIIKS